MTESYRLGGTIDKLAPEFGVHRTTVMATLERQNVARRRTSNKLDRRAIEEAVARYRGGDSLATIADQFGVHPTTIANKLRAAGEPLRARRGWAKSPHTQDSETL